MKEEKRLIVPEKENIFTRFFKWVSNIFGKKEKNIWNEQLEEKNSDFIIPKDVAKIQIEKEPEDENSLEYLYKLSDKELDELNLLYDTQVEEAKNEIEKLENILQNYKQSIKKLQEDIADNEA